MIHVTNTWKILILFASYGEGHYQVSRVLQQGFMEKGIENVRMLDLFAEAHPLIDAITKYVYSKSFSFASSLLYGWTYYATRDMRQDTLLAQWFHSFGFRKLREIIEQEQPDVVINTFPMLVMPMIRKKKGAMIPTVTVLTDFALHNRWIHPAIDRYYVPTKELKKELEVEGIPSTKVRVTGIPIKKEFEQLFYHPSTFFNEKYGLDPSKKFVLVMAGAYGKSTLKKICQSFLHKNQFDLLVVCGRNQSLQVELEKCYAGSNIHVLGFVAEIHYLMSLSSCVITKAGGITLSEALAMNLPIVLLQPVPGQERENARYLTNKGAAITINHIEEIADQISRLLGDEVLLLKIQKSLQSLHRPHSAVSIIQDILDYLHESSHAIKQ
jgi:processive 1,2-diacylglycerol beta-glucosyltransferase